MSASTTDQAAEGLHLTGGFLSISEGRQYKGPDGTDKVGWPSVNVLVGSTVLHVEYPNMEQVNQALPEGTERGEPITLSVYANGAWSTDPESGRRTRGRVSYSGRQPRDS